VSRAAPARGLPLLPTLVVALAAALMVALGCWQLFVRLPQKQALLAQLATNPQLPPIAFPHHPDDRLLFRRASAPCPAPGAAFVAGAGAAGFRWVVPCAVTAAAPAMLVQLGTTRDPNLRPRWAGGRVTGYLSHAPDSRSMLASLFDRAPKPMMLVAADPPSGLQPNAAPDLGSVPNNHLAYGVQWFLFAGVALIVYVLALRRYRRPAAAPRPA
jgi:surfeit locus 1 family protein